MPREQLLSLLDAQLAATPAGPAVLLVTAPAGAGKTTMLATWAHRHAGQTDTHVAWVGLDSSDNNPVLLWTAIQRALEGSGAWPPDGAVDALIPQPRCGGFSTPFLSAVIAAVEALPRRVLLILDDVHEVTSRAALHSLNFLLRHLPAALRVIIASRFPPPLILPRLRLEGRVREVNPDCLIFTRAEAGALLANEGIELTGTQLDQLMAKTEGWAAGLRLAAITMTRAGEPFGRLTGFTGDQRAVADYLVEEILARQPQHVRRLLMCTSICRTFTVDLAVELSGQENAGEILDRLERNNMLIGHRGRAPRWYRCHPLLRGYLRAELARRRPTAKQRLHRVAATWFQAAGEPLQALQHSIASGDDDLVTDVVTTFGLRQVLDGQVRGWRSALEAAPVRTLSRPAVALVAAALALDQGDLPGADRCLRRMRAIGQPVRSRRLRSLNAAVSLYRARLVGDRGPSTSPYGESGDVDVDLLALLNRGTVAAWAGRHARAKADLRHALQLATAEGCDGATLHCRIHLAGLAAAEGELAGMSKQAAVALELARGRNWAGTARCAYLYALLGYEAYLRLDTERAAELAALAVDLLASRTDPPIKLFARILGAAVSFDTSADPYQVVAIMRGHWQRMRGKQIPPALIAFAAPIEQRMVLRVGELAWVADVLDRVESRLGPCGEHALLQANLQAHKGKLSSARRILAPVISDGTTTIAALTSIDAWLLEAQLAERCADNRGAHEALRQALLLAEPHQILRPFHDAGQPVRDLLAQGTGRYGRLDRFASMVIAALPAAPNLPTDALTIRELTLLAELPSMRTTEEIAKSLFVSVNTVKTHLRGIYRKLGVNHRRDAVTAARQHGLL